MEKENNEKESSSRLGQTKENKKKVDKKDTDKKVEGKSEEVCEYFEIEKKGKEEIVKSCGEEKPNEEQRKKHKKQLKGIFIVLGIAVIILLLAYIIVNSIRHFEFDGVKYNVVKEGNIIFYNAVFPQYSMTGNVVGNFNAYLRNDPRKISSIPFEGDLQRRDIMLINASNEEELSCEGDGVIAIANMVNIFGNFGTKSAKDLNASCDSLGRYMFVQIEPGNETKIQKIGPACYRLTAEKCDILPVTERFTTELFKLVKSGEQI